MKPVPTISPSGAADPGTVVRRELAGANIRCHAESMGHSENIFDGPAQTAPEPMAQQATISWTADLTAARLPVRHLTGYVAFVDFSESLGAPALSADVCALLDFLRQHAAVLAADTALADAAAVYLGNVIASLRADAYWQLFDGAEISVGNDSIQFTPMTLIERLRETENWAPTMRDLLQDWAGEVIAEPMPYPVLAGSRPGTPRYERPPWSEATYYAADGTVIRYGERWNHAENGPPENSYSVTSDLERFAGIHVVAEALINHLTCSYDVTVTDDPGCADDLSMAGADVIRAVRIVPRSEQAAPLTIVFTSFPGLMVHAGVLHDFVYPQCGCDACDDTALSQVEQLEELVLGVASGNYHERYPVGSKRESQYALINPDGSGSRSGGNGMETTDPARLDVAEHRLRGVPGGWRPWPLRAR
jgi:hypothetical protein